MRVLRLATSSMVGGEGSLSSSASASAPGPTGMPRAKRRFWAASRDFFSSQRRSQG